MMRGSAATVWLRSPPPSCITTIAPGRPEQARLEPGRPPDGAVRRGHRGAAGIALVVIAVVGELLARLQHRAGLTRYLLPDLEERPLGMVMLQDREDLRRVGARPVVERQGDPSRTGGPAEARGSPGVPTAHRLGATEHEARVVTVRRSIEAAVGRAGQLALRPGPLAHEAPAVIAGVEVRPPRIEARDH